MFKVERGVKIPKPSKGGLGPVKYPWDSLSVGDSFLIPRDEWPPSGYKSIGNAMRAAAASRKTSYRLRLVEDGARVWRIK